MTTELEAIAAADEEARSRVALAEARRTRDVAVTAPRSAGDGGHGAIV